MSDSHAQNPDASPSRRRRGLFRRDEDGLTTLEWLLIVAAVAGLAALAVVLVQTVVDDTAEQIGGSSARKTAAIVAADAIMQEADRDSASQPTAAKTYAGWKNYYINQCNRLEITYSDAGITTSHVFANNDAGTTEDDDPVAASAITVGLPDANATGFAALGATPAANTAHAHCYVN